MAPLTHHLVSLSPETDSQSFIAALRKLPEPEKPLWVGQCHHWIHEPRLSVAALTGSGSDLKKWDYLVIVKAQDDANAFHLLPSIDAFLADKWSITAEVADDFVDDLAGKERLLAAETHPSLSEGWSTDNHAALDASEPPTDLNTSLGTKAPTLGQDKNDSKIDVKTFVRNFGTSPEGAGPIAMFNLLSFFPGRMTDYFKYVTGFMEVLGPQSGGLPVTIGLQIHDWSSRTEDLDDAGDWEMANLIWYPTIWHFGQMLGDPRYAQLDRDFKTGVVRDNPLICCTSVDLD